MNLTIIRLRIFVLKINKSIKYLAVRSLLFKFIIGKCSGPACHASTGTGIYRRRQYYRRAEYGALQLFPDFSPYNLVHLSCTTLFGRKKSEVVSRHPLTFKPLMHGQFYWPKTKVLCEVVKLFSGFF